MAWGTSIGLLVSLAWGTSIVFDINPYWMEKNIIEYTRKKHNNPECMRILERIVFFIAGKVGCISHTVPDYKVTLDKGVEYIISGSH